jgi:hypothetical protein
MMIKPDECISLTLPQISAEDQQQQFSSILVPRDMLMVVHPSVELLLHTMSMH